MYPVKTPWLLKKLYPKLVWNVKPTSRCIYLTFDDGPIPIVTPFVLNILKQYNAKATFFCIGDNVNKHPDIFEQVKKQGHAIGNHTYNHLKGWKTDDNTYLENFIKTDNLLHTNLFRPPYGRIKITGKSSSKSQTQFTNHHVDDTFGYFDINLEPGKCLDNVIKNTISGDIVLFHDSLKAQKRMEYTLPKAMEHWSKEGFEFKCLG